MCRCHLAILALVVSRAEFDVLSERRRERVGLGSELRRWWSSSSSSSSSSSRAYLFHLPLSRTPGGEKEEEEGE